MSRELPWTRTMNARLGATMVLVAAISLTLVVLNMHMLKVIRGDSIAMDLTSRGPARVYEILYLTGEIPELQGAARATALRSLRDATQRMDVRYQHLRRGDPARGLPPTSHPRLLADLDLREAQWRNEIRPIIEQLMSPGIDDATARALRDRLEPLSRTLIQHAEETSDLYMEVGEARLALYQNAQVVLLIVVGGLVLVAFLITRSISRRARALATTAERIATGELTLDAPVSGGDELALLGSAFNTMTANLRTTIVNEQSGRKELEKLIEGVQAAVNSVTSASAEILAATTQQAAGAQEQASAVTETVTTVDEVLQTSDQAAERARAVADSAHRSAEISNSGRRAVEETISVIGTVSSQTESIAESILALAEQAQAIGEIIATVNEIAEQTNILALNAAIEASRAGEHGKAFGVVAGEVKVLAEQSRKATAQVRQILGDIQKATNTAVIAAENGTKSVSAATLVVHEAGDTIRMLTETISEASQVAGQIAASATQQVTGMSQIHLAMKNINQVTHQNLASTRQSERAAQDLNELAVRLKSLLSSHA